MKLARRGGDRTTKLLKSLEQRRQAGRRNDVEKVISSSLGGKNLAAPARKIWSAARQRRRSGPLAGSLAAFSGWQRPRSGQFFTDRALFFGPGALPAARCRYLVNQIRRSSRSPRTR
jgi:hypothetical protein